MNLGRCLWLLLGQGSPERLGPSSPPGILTLPVAGALNYVWPADIAAWRRLETLNCVLVYRPRIDGSLWQDGVSHMFHDTSPGEV